MTHLRPRGRMCTHSSYRMTCEEFDSLLTRAKERCEICRTPPEKTGHGILFIDHDYEVGQWAVRGLLCSTCNSQLPYHQMPYQYFRRHRRAVRCYLASPWWQSHLAELGFDGSMLPEPPVGTRVRGPRTWWRRTEAGWWGNHSKQTHPWSYLHHRYGPHRLVIEAAPAK